MEGLMGWAVLLLTIFFVGVSIVMTGLILLQEGKGGGLAALGGTKAAGIEGVTNPIRRATAYLAVIFFIIAIALSVLRKPAKSHFADEPISAGAGASAKAPEAPTAPALTSTTPAEAPKVSTSSVATPPANTTTPPAANTKAPPPPANPAAPAEKK